MKSSLKNNGIWKCYVLFISLRRKFRQDSQDVKIPENITNLKFLIFLDEILYKFLKIKQENKLNFVFSIFFFCCYWLFSVIIILKLIMKSIEYFQYRPM